MNNFYIKSWQLYKAHSESFKDDYEYYLNFTKGHKTLELFAGYGRLSNFLGENGVDIETVELEPNFAKFISIPKNKNHVCSVLDFNPSDKFERIIAGFNSFCLLTQENDIRKFFQNIDSWLLSGGLVSLSYYHPDVWEARRGQTFDFDFNNKTAVHISGCDLSKRDSKLGVWIDEYQYDNKREIYSYPTRIYETSECLMPYLQGTSLSLENTIDNYNKQDLSDPGWVEFVLRKK